MGGGIGLMQQQQQQQTNPLILTPVQLTLFHIFTASSFSNLYIWYFTFQTSNLKEINWNKIILCLGSFMTIKHEHNLGIEINIPYILYYLIYVFLLNMLIRVSELETGLNHQPNTINQTHHRKLF